MSFIVTRLGYLHEGSISWRRMDVIWVSPRDIQVRHAYGILSTGGGARGISTDLNVRPRNQPRLR